MDHFVFNVFLCIFMCFFLYMSSLLFLKDFPWDFKKNVHFCSSSYLLKYLYSSFFLLNLLLCGLFILNGIIWHLPVFYATMILFYFPLSVFILSSNFKLYSFYLVRIFNTYKLFSILVPDSYLNLRSTVNIPHAHHHYFASVSL